MRTSGRSGLVALTISAVALVSASTAWSVPIGGGWDADVGASDASIIVDQITDDYILIEVSKNFTQDPNEQGEFPPIDILFTQIGDDADTAPQIVIADESVTNLTSFLWTDYHWGIEDATGPVWFELGQDGFDTAPFGDQTLGGFLDPGPDTQPTLLDVAGGMLAVGDSFYPGGGAGASGELIINADLSGDDVSFAFTQYPTPEPGTLALLAMGGVLAIRRRRILRDLTAVAPVVLILVASLAMTANVEAACDTCPAGTIALTDTEGDVGGWCVSTNQPGNVTFVVVDVDPTSGIIDVKLNKNFMDPPGFGNTYNPILFDFVQVCDDAETLSMIRIQQELIVNQTGSDWGSFKWLLFDGEAATFDPSSSAFDVSPYTNLDLTDTSAIASGGVVPDQMTFTPGALGGDLKMNVDLSGDQVSFTLKELPMCTPVSITCPDDVVAECDGMGNLTDIADFLGGVSAEGNCGDIEITDDFNGFTVDCGLTGMETLSISLGIRQTGSTAGIGDDGGTSGGIEWVNKDGQSLTIDGTWQLFTFDLNNDALSPFAGGTADGMLDGVAGTIEHIRIVNADGVTAPLAIYIDEVAETVDPAGLPLPSTTTFGDFEGLALGSESMFQEPGFSGSTAGNISTSGLNIAQVVDDMSFAGAQAYRAEFSFVDDTPTRWVRWTTFNGALLPGSGSPTIVWDPANSNVVQFWMKAEAASGTEVTFTATDSAGNVDECIANFTVVDTIAPSVTCSARVADCCENGDPVVLTMRYTGEGCDASSTTQPPDKWSCGGDPAFAEPVRIISNDDSDPFDTSNVWFDGMVNVGDNYDIDARVAGENKLKSATFIHILDGNDNVLQTVEFHTSCSQPLFLGNQFGANLLVGCLGEDEVGPAPVSFSLDECLDGPMSVLRDTSCSDFDLDQDGDVDLRDFALNQLLRTAGGDPVPVLIEYSATDDLCTTTGVTAVVDLGNCGVIEVDDFETINLECSTGDCCEDGDLVSVMATYTGEDCLASSTSQPSDKWDCSGDPAFASPVRIIASDKVDPFDGGANVWFDGQVNLNDTFDINAANAGESKLKSATFVHILDANDNVLQTVEFHTSCSQPLFTGDQFGSVVVDTCFGADGTGECKPESAILTVTATDDCGNADVCELDLCAILAFNKYECDGPITSLTMQWNGGGAIRVIAYDGDTGDPIVQDIDNIQPADIITIAGFSGSPNNVVWEIYAAGTNNLLGTSEFHLSCSDRDMDDAADCGSAQGDGKDDDAGLINDWIFVGQISDGGTLDCAVAP